MIELLLTLCFAGIIAGLVQYFVDFRGLPLYEPAPALIGNESQSGWTELWLAMQEHWQLVGYIVIGIAGALIIPAIHNLINLKSIDEYIACLSNAELQTCKAREWYLMVIFAYGIISGYSSVRIIRGFGSVLFDRIGRHLRQNQQSVEQLNRQIYGIKKDLAEPVMRGPGIVGLAQNVVEPVVIDSQKYFDKKQNELNKKSYYAGVDFINTDALFDRLNKLITGTHRNQLPYKPALHLYPLVDRYSDEKLRSIYSGEAFDLQEILELDAQVDRLRLSAINTSMSVGLSAEEISDQMEALEDRLPYNCEHVIPQSWFGRKEPMRGDLHHLFTCESGCNSFRNNHKYYDFADYGIREVERGECGKLASGLFEPENNKGVVARAVLYFLLRYPSSFIDNYGYHGTDLDMLNQWHEEQPVTLYELHRNQEIFKVQGNRNPFIDFPDLFLEFNEFLTNVARPATELSNG